MKYLLELTNALLQFETSELIKAARAVHRPSRETEEIRARAEWVRI